MIANQDIRGAIFNASLKYWEIAHELGCTDSTFSKKLRTELPEEEKKKILSIVKKLSKEGEKR